MKKSYFDTLYNQMIDNLNRTTHPIFTRRSELFIDTEKLYIPAISFLYDKSGDEEYELRVLGKFESLAETQAKAIDNLVRSAFPQWAQSVWKWKRAKWLKLTLLRLTARAIGVQVVRQGAETKVYKRNKCLGTVIF